MSVVPAARPANRTPKGLLWALVLAYAAMIPYQIEVATELRIAPADACLILVGLLGIGSLRFRRTAWTGWHYALALVFLLSLWTGLSARGYLTRYVLLNKCIGLAFLFFGYAVVTSLADTWERVHMLLRVFVASVAVQNIGAIVAFAFTMATGTSVPMINSGDKRLCGMLGDANGYGGMLVAALALIELTAVGGYPLLRGLFRYIATATLGLGILLTFSRSAWISLALVVFWSCFFERRFALRIAVIGAVAGMLTLALFGTQFIDYARPMAQRPEQVAERFELVESAWQSFQSSPITGIGLGRFVEKEDRIVHNTTLWFLAEFGVIGLSAYAGLMGWYLYRGYCAMRSGPPLGATLARAVLACHIGMLGLSIGIEAFYKRDWWLVMSAIAAAWSICARQRRTMHQPARRLGPAFNRMRQEVAP